MLTALAVEGAIPRPLGTRDSYHPRMRGEHSSASPLSRGEGEAELISRLRSSEDPGAVWAPELVAGRGEGRGGGGDHVDSAVVADPGGEVFQRDPYRQVGLTGLAEVGRGEGEAELISRLRSSEDPGAVLAPELVAGRGEAPGGAVDHVDPAVVADPGGEVLQRDPYRQVGLTGLAEVGRGEGEAELISRLRSSEDPGAVLAPELVAGRGEAPGGAVDHVDPAVVGLPGGEVLQRDPHR